MVEKEVKIRVAADVDDGQVKALEDLLDSLADKVVGFEVAVEDGEIDGALEKEDELNTTAEVDIEVNDAGIQVAMQNIKDGFSSIKQGASEVGALLNEALASAGKQETNKAFLEQALGDPKTAEKKLQNINSIVQKLPGDDSVMQGLLGQAVAKDASLTTQELTKMGGAASDYFAAMKNYGKSSSEAFQDMNNYLMTGNTAEIERSPILANHIDKLKEGTTIQERSALLQQALNEEHWGGISAQDTYNNKLETFNGMLERGQYTLGGMFQEGAKGAMDFALKLDDASGGLVGIGLAAVSFASPLTDMVIGLGQMATGMQAIKNIGIVAYLKNLSIVSKLSAISQAVLSAATAAYGVVVGVLTGEITLAEAATMAWNAILAMNPLALVAVAAVALAVAVYEVGKAFGWWSSVGTMLESIQAGLQRLWAAFINNPDVQAFIQGVRDAWTQVSNALKPVVDWVMQFLGIHTGGQFDIVRALIDGVAFAWRNIKPIIMVVIQAVSTFVSRVASGIARAKMTIETLKHKWTTLKNAIRGAADGIKSAITKPFEKAYSIVKPIIDKLQGAWDMLTSLSGSAGITTGSAGISMGSVNGIGSANTNLISNISNATGGRPNIVLNGIIEESAGDFIVRKLSDEIYKQNVLRGVE